MQARFRAFDQAIDLQRLSNNPLLREIRDGAFDRLRKGLHQIGVKVSFTHIDQGSYALGTAIKPLTRGTHHIDVGVIFEVNATVHDSHTVKGWVFEALQAPGVAVRWRRPCITLRLPDGDQLNLPVYARRNGWSGGLMLARGRQRDAAVGIRWEAADPIGLSAWLNNRFIGEQDLQFRRCVRILKRWKAVNGGYYAPVGIGLTIAAAKWLEPHREGENDLGVLLAFVQRLRARFNLSRVGAESLWGLELGLPVAPYANVFGKLRPMRSNELHQRLVELELALTDAQRLAKRDELSAAAHLARVFGGDFPIS